MRKTKDVPVFWDADDGLPWRKNSISKRNGGGGENGGFLIFAKGDCQNFAGRESARAEPAYSSWESREMPSAKMRCASSSRA